jgi:uncharacterized membrane protein (UPF0127 family)
VTPFLPFLRFRRNRSFRSALPLPATLGCVAHLMLAAALGLGTVTGLTLLGPSHARAELSARLPKAKLKAGGVVFRVDLAELPEDQSLGLGGRKHLEPDEGMLFVYREKGRQAFWMHGMLISIDMLWLDNGRIVHIVHRAPPPKPGMTDADLPLYEPQTPANFVLEIAAGRAAALGLKIGDKVEFDFSGR